MVREPVAQGEQPTNLLNVAEFILRNPRKSAVVVRKVLDRLSRSKKNAPSRQNTAWINAHSVEASDVARGIAPDLWEEAERFASVTHKRGEAILKNLPVAMGGGGDFRFLYWLTRLYRPSVVVETGVAAGWTSAAVLAAMRENGTGTLHSSDFPYFRLKRPEDYIGCIVEPELRDRWTLYLDGDAKVLPRIVSQVPKIDLFHYDSDKSWSGRDRAVTLVRSKLSPDGLILMDDILNNDWFRTYVEREQVPFMVIGGRVGLIGQLRSAGSIPLP